MPITYTNFSVVLITLPTVIVGKCPLTGQETPNGYEHRNGRYYKVNTYAHYALLKCTI